MITAAKARRINDLNRKGNKSDKGDELLEQRDDQGDDDEKMPPHFPAALKKIGISKTPVQIY